MHLLAAEREPVLAGEDGMASPRPSPDLLKCLVFLLSGTTLQGWQAGGSSDTHSLSLIPPPHQHLRVKLRQNPSQLEIMFSH